MLTAYTSAEAIETLRRFPLVDGAVIDAGMRDMECSQLVKALRKIQPGLKVVAICPTGCGYCNDATVELETFDPKKLLGEPYKLVPQATKAIEEHEEDLANRQSGSAG